MFERFKKVEFRLLCQHSEEAAINVSDYVRREGFSILDLREAEIVMNSDNSKIDSVYVMCCEGSELEYHRLRRNHDFKEIMYENYKTLM